jgi:hypothetical protein
MEVGVNVWRLSMLGLLIAIIGGCAGVTPLPDYPAMSDADAMRTIADRQEAVRSVSAECDLYLTDPQGQTVSLDGVLVAQTPGSLRLRAWKFGHAVFDLTLTGGKGWVMLPDNRQAARKLDPANISARRVGDAFELLGPSYFRTASSVNEVRPTGGPLLVVRGWALGRDDVVCEIDRRTLTPRRFVMGTADGTNASEIKLDGWAVTQNGMVWPLRMSLASPMGEVLVVIRSVELNGDIPVGAFVPPKRAVELP